MAESDFLSWLQGYGSAENKAMYQREQEVQIQRQEEDLAARKRKAEDEIRSNMIGRFANLSLSGLSEPLEPQVFGPPKPLWRRQSRDKFTPEQIAIGTEEGIITVEGDDVLVNFESPEIKLQMRRVLEEMAGLGAKTAEAETNQVALEKLADAAEIASTDPDAATRMFEEVQIRTGKASPQDLALARREMRARLAILPKLEEGATTGAVLDVDGNPIPVGQVSLTSSSWSISFMREMSGGAKPQDAVKQVFMGIMDNVPRIVENYTVAKNDDERMGVLNGLKGMVRTAVIALDPMDQARVAVRLHLPYDPANMLESLEKISQRYVEITIPEAFGVKKEPWFKDALAGLGNLWEGIAGESAPKRPRPETREEGAKKLDSLFGAGQP